MDGETSRYATAELRHERPPLRLRDLPLPEVVDDRSDWWTILVCAGGPVYTPAAQCLLRDLHRFESAATSPWRIEWWFADDDELTTADRAAVWRSLPPSMRVRVSFRNATTEAAAMGVPTGGSLRGVQLKPFALYATQCRHVLLLDADNHLLADPETLTAWWMAEARRGAGGAALMWPDFFHEGFSSRLPDAARAVGCKATIYSALSRPLPVEEGGSRPGGAYEVESGQMLVDRARCREALRCVWYLNARRDVVYQHTHGDKDTFPLAFRLTRTPYTMVPFVPHCVGVRVPATSAWRTQPIEAVRWRRAEAAPELTSAAAAATTATAVASGGSDLLPAATAFDDGFVGVGFVQRHPATGEPLFEHRVFAKRRGVVDGDGTLVEEHVEWWRGDWVVGQLRRRDCGPMYAIARRSQ